MKLITLGKISFSAALILALMAPNVLPFSAEYAAAQGASGGAGAGLSTGFQAGGIIASAISCSGLIDKAATALSNLFGAVVKEVPVGDAGLRTKENCFDALVHQLVVLILDKITLATVDWINNGFEGQPLYLYDPEQFFSNIAQDEINRVTGWFGCTMGSVTCSEDYPFGQIIMANLISSIQTQLAANVQFSLNQVLAHGTYEEYKVDFNVGGWAGYTAMLQPNNNIFGANMLVNKELGRRISGTSMTISKNLGEQVKLSGGFLNQRRCVVTATGDPADQYIPENDDTHVPPGGPVPAAVYEDLGMQPDDIPTEQEQMDINGYIWRSQCVEWRTQTPGNVIGSKITTALNISDNRLIQADEVSESLGLIFDALINQLVKTGLESLASYASPNGGGGGLNSVLVQQVNGQEPGQVQNNQTPPPAIEAVTGTGDTGIASVELVLVQQQYIDAANQALPVLTNIIQKIHGLDYCVPGPNPNWLDNAQVNLEVALQSVPPFASGNTNATAAENENQDYYAGAINTLTGINIDQSTNMHNHTQFLAFMNNLLVKYAEKMQNTADQGYNRFLAPPATRILLQPLLEDLPVYQSSYDSLSTYLTNISSYLPTLISIQNTLNQISQQPGNNGSIPEGDPQVQAQISLFNSISDHLATQNQLTLLESSMNAYQAQEGIINAHLTSCLNETVITAYPHPNKRIQYPAAILPTYNQTTSGVTGMMPNPDTTFLPGVDWNDSTTGGDINAAFAGVQLNGMAPLATFEALIQSVY